MNGIRIIISFLIVTLLTSCSFLSGSPETKNNVITDVSKAGWEVSPFHYINQEGKTFSSDDLKGTYWLANMIFTSCPTVCQVMTPNMVLIQEEVNKRDLELQFISFTVDPQVDNPEQLKRYGNAYGANFENYQFLTGYTDEEISEFAKQSFKSMVQKMENSYDIAHSVNFFLVDTEGKVVRMYNGDTDFDLKMIIKDLKSIIK